MRKVKDTLHRHIAINILCTAMMLLPLFLFSSCYDDIAAALTRTPIKLSASTEPAQTRAHRATGDPLDLQNTAFDEDEKIAVYIKDTDGNAIADGSGNPHWPAVFTADAENTTTHLNLLEFSPQLYYPTENKSVSIHAYYPQTVDAKEATGTALKTSTLFSVATDQSALDAYKASDLMFATIPSQARTSGNVNLNFAHKLVKFVFNVAADGDVTIDECYLYQVATKIGFNPTTGEVTQLSESECNRQNVLLDNGGAVIIPPQTLSGTFIVVKGSARKDGQSDLTDVEARFSLKVENGALTTRELQSGKVYTVNITVGYDNFNKTYEIGEWDDEAGVISIAALGSTGFSTDDTTINADGYDYTGSEIEIPGLKVMYGSKVLTMGTHYELLYFNNVHAGKATVLAIGKGAYEGYAVAASFTINQIASSLQYTDIDGTTDKQTLSVEYSRNYTINPTATTPKDIHLNIVGNGTMSYTISNVSGDTETVADNVATIENGTGVITVKGIGTVLVKATMLDDKDYLGSSDSFVLTVTERTFDPNDESKIRVDFNPPTYTFDGNEHKPTVTVWDKIANTGVDSQDWANITTSCTITYPDPVNATKPSGDNTTTYVNIKLNAPYEGTIKKYYTINKATPTLTILEGNSSGTIINSTLPLYLGRPNTNTSANLTRQRTAISDFGDPVFEPKDNATNDIFNISTETVNGAANANTAAGVYRNTIATFTAKAGSDEGNITYTVYVEGTDNYNRVSADFIVYVVPSEFTYTYSGNTQQFVCKATGEYLLEVWGAQGGYGDNGYSGDGTTLSLGGAGAHVSGKIKLNKDDVLYVNVGQAGQTMSSYYNAYTEAGMTSPNPQQSQWQNGVTSGFYDRECTDNTYTEAKVLPRGFAWNGGGGIVWGLRHWFTNLPWRVADPIAGGGGATDISLAWSGTTSDWQNPAHMLTRIIVAGGGGGAIYYSADPGAGNGADGGYGTITADGLAGKTVSTTTLLDPGEGGKINRGGKGGQAAGNGNSYPYGSTYTNIYDGRMSYFSGSDGIFGEGGYYYCIEEGGGSGGGGWYGGGAAGQHGGNGSGGGGSSYVWCAGLSSYYPTFNSLKNVTSTSTVASSFYYYEYKTSSSVQTPVDRTYRYIYDATAVRSGDTSSSKPMANGRAKITCLSTSNSVDLGGRN